ncbi:hypothetical protein VUR80DRAFT_455 [Thermomyces stellatus]
MEDGILQRGEVRRRYLSSFAAVLGDKAWLDSSTRPAWLRSVALIRNGGDPTSRPHNCVLGVGMPGVPSQTCSVGVIKSRVSTTSKSCKRHARCRASAGLDGWVGGAAAPLTRTLLGEKCAEVRVSENIGRCISRNRPQEREGELAICEAEPRTQYFAQPRCQGISWFLATEGRSSGLRMGTRRRFPEDAGQLHGSSAPLKLLKDITFLV